MLGDDDPSNPIIARSSAIRRHLVRGAVAFLAIACATFWFGFLQPLHRHIRWYREIECLIVELAPRRPSEVTPERWAYCLHHTWNLHSNYGNSVYWDASRAAAFEEEFRDRLQNKVGLDTIDWFWDAYVRGAPRARHYLRVRPTPAERLMEADSSHEYDLDHWLAKRNRTDCEGLGAE
jgi:hypothetical protein